MIVGNEATPYRVKTLGRVPKTEKRVRSAFSLHPNIANEHADVWVLSPSLSP